MDSFRNRVRERRIRTRQRSEILTHIADKWTYHDFIGEILEDRWIECVATEASCYLTDKEKEALGATSTEEEEDTSTAVTAGEHVVMRAFVIWLCKHYEIGPEDLGGILVE